MPCRTTDTQSRPHSWMADVVVPTLPTLPTFLTVPTAGFTYVFNAFKLP